MKGDTRCIEGRRWRHSPGFYDPYFEMDIGQCPECEGDGCYRCEDCGGTVYGAGSLNEAGQCEDCYQTWLEEQPAPAQATSQEPQG